MSAAAKRTRAGALATALAAGALLLAPSPGAATPEDEFHELVHEEADGGVRSHDGVLERGCQSHPYRYRVEAGESDWSLELFLVDRRGRTVANGYEWKDADPAQGRGRFRFCSQVTKPGRFTVRARLTWDDGAYHETRLEPVRIRLRRG